MTVPLFKFSRSVTRGVPWLRSREREPPGHVYGTPTLLSQAQVKICRMTTDGIGEENDRCCERFEVFLISASLLFRRCYSITMFPVSFTMFSHCSLFEFVCSAFSSSGSLELVLQCAPPPLPIHPKSSETHPKRAFSLVCFCLFSPPFRDSL